MRGCVATLARDAARPTRYNLTAPSDAARRSIDDRHARPGELAGAREALSRLVRLAAESSARNDEPTTRRRD